MPVAKVVELIGSSSESFDDALKQAVERASKKLRGVSGFDVVGQKVVIKDNQISEYRVVVKAVFRLED